MYFINIFRPRAARWVSTALGPEDALEALAGALSLPGGCLNRNFGASKQLQRLEAVDAAMVAKGIYQYLITIAAGLGC